MIDALATKNQVSTIISVRGIRDEGFHNFREFKQQLRRTVKNFNQAIKLKPESDKQKKAVECNQRTQNENDAGATHRHF